MFKRAAWLALLSLVGVVAFGQAAADPAAKATAKQSRKAEAKAQAPAAEGAKENVVKVLRTSNKAQTNKFVCDAFEFKNVNPFDVINFMWAPVSREEGGIYSFLAPDGKSGYVVVMCPDYQLEWLRKMAKDLDRTDLKSAPGSKYIYYRMRHRNVTDPNFLTNVQYYIGASGVLIPDVETDSMLIFDAPVGAVEGEKALTNELDQPMGQVDVDVKLYEIDVNNDGTLGLDYAAWKNGPGKVLGQYATERGSYNTVHSGHSGYHSTGHGYYLDYPSAFFDFMVSKGKAKLVTNGKIAAVNRVPAMLTTGEQVLYYEVTATEDDREVWGKTQPLSVAGISFPTNGRVLTAGNAREPLRSSDPSYPVKQYPQSGRAIQSNVNSVDTGISLAIVPTIGQNVVTLDLELKVANLAGFDNAGIPLLNSRQIADSMAVPNGETALFGGLSRDSKVKTTRKIPLLGSLPVIGYIFGGEITLDKKTVVVAALTPRLVDGGNNVTGADELVAKKAQGEEVVVLPKSEFCFEQSVQKIY